MENQRQNPLAGYFRQPAIYIKLPSGGRWWGENALDLPVTGEIPIYPMTTKDEIVLRTPDALLNGQGIVDVIESCCPNIKNAWEMPGIDADAILIAIRIATYGNGMNVDSKCTNCQEENTHEVNLGQTLANIKAADYNDLVLYKDLKIKLKPQHYMNVNRANMIGFEEQRLINAINDSELPVEEKARRVAESMQKLVDLGTDASASATDYIEKPDGDRVYDQEFIKEFYLNAESSAIDEINKKLEKFAADSRVKPLNLMCNSCQQPYVMEMTFDYANFFGKGF